MAGGRRRVATEAPPPHHKMKRLHLDELKPEAVEGGRRPEGIGGDDTARQHGPPNSRPALVRVVAPASWLAVLIALAALLLSGHTLRSERGSSSCLWELEQQVAFMQGVTAELSTGVVALAEEVDGLRQLVSDVQQRMPAPYLADGTGRPDFALASVGARVVGSSATLLPRSLRLLQHTTSRLFPSLLTLADQYLLSPGIVAGRCLPLRGPDGYVDIKLSRAVHVEALVYEHLPASQQHSQVSSAPSKLGLYASLGAAGLGAAPLILGSFLFNASGSSLQTFPVNGSGLVDHVRVAGQFEATALHPLRGMQGLLGRLRMSGVLGAPAANSVHEQLYALLFPGQTYSTEFAGSLAYRLHQAAAELEQLAGTSKDSGATHKDIDFAAYQRRYVALELLYLGHRYDGFARQDSTLETIEEHLLAAFRKARLVPMTASWQQLQYSRGGRTDKGVSALGQVVALQLRSAGRAGQSTLPEEQEMDYPTLLNRALPDDIRVLGWTTAPEGFSARFSARFREYKYFIVDNHGGLNVERMQEAAAHLVGEHDFRNFCKPDVAAVKSFRRRILEVRLRPVHELSWGGKGILELYIRGTAFLWHQVRCLAAVLLMVGRGQEDPSVVEALLDLRRIPGKPNYHMASDEPLLLYNCSYEGLHFRRSQANYDSVLNSLEHALSSHLVRGALLHAIEGKLNGDDRVQQGVVAKRQRGHRHIPLLARTKGATIEQRRRRLADSLAAAAAAAPEDALLTAAATGAAAAADWEAAEAEMLAAVRRCQHAGCGHLVPAFPP